jgi:hypothetical protein
MTVKISGAFPKDLLAFNGLEIHRDSIVQAEFEAGADEEGWTGYAVARLSVKKVERLAGGEMVPHVQIDHIEVMEGPRVEPARRALLDTFKERATNGVVDPVQDDLFDGVPEEEIHPYWKSVDADRDPYENPDEAPETHHGVPVERVELPAENVERLPGESDREYEAAVDAMKEAEEHGRERAPS